MKRKVNRYGIVKEFLLEFMRSDDTILIIKNWQSVYSTEKSAVSSYNSSAKRLDIPVVARCWRGSVYLVKLSEDTTGFSHIFL